jgi:hypothetical protein
MMFAPASKRPIGKEFFKRANEEIVDFSGHISACIGTSQPLRAKGLCMFFSQTTVVAGRTNGDFVTRLSQKLCLDDNATKVTDRPSSRN